MNGTIEIQGIQLTRRGPGEVGTLRAVQRLKEEHGVDLLSDSKITEQELLGLIYKAGALKDLLHALYTGDVDAIDEDRIELTMFTKALPDFFEAPGEPSSEQPAG